MLAQEEYLFYAWDFRRYTSYENVTIKMFPYAAGLAEMNNAVPVIAEVRFPDLRSGYGEGEEAPKGGVGFGGTGNKAQWALWLISHELLVKE